MKILIADDERGPRRLMRMMLSSLQEVEIVEAGSVEEAIRVITTHSPGVLLLELRMGIEETDCGGLEILRRVRASGLQAKVVMIAESLELSEIREAIRLGAQDYLLWQMLTPEVLVPLVEELSGGQVRRPATGRSRKAPGVIDMANHPAAERPAPTTARVETPPPATEAPSRNEQSVTTEPPRRHVQRVVTENAGHAEETVQYDARPLEGPGLFGRAEELCALDRFLTNDRIRVAVVTGAAGVGKTTVVREFVRRSAKCYPKNHLISARAIPIDGLTAQSLLWAVASAARVPGAWDVEMSRRLHGHLRDRPMLVVLDDLDEVSPSEIEKLVTAFEQFPRNGSRAVLVVRDVPPGIRERVEVVSIDGLPSDVATMHVEHLVRRRSPITFSLPMDARELAAAFGGHPKMLDLAVGIAAQAKVDVFSPDAENGPPSPWRRTEARQWQILVDRAVESLGGDGRWVLELLALFPDGSFTVEELRAAANAMLAWPEDTAVLELRLSVGLRECLTVGLVDHEPAADLYRMHAAVRAHVGGHGASQAASKSLGFFGLLSAAMDRILEQPLNIEALERRFTHVLRLFDAAWQLPEGTELRRALRNAFSVLEPHFRRHGQWLVRAHWQPRVMRIHHSAQQFTQAGSEGGTDPDGRDIDAIFLLVHLVPTHVRARDDASLATALVQLAFIERRRSHEGEARILADHAARIVESIGDPSSLRDLALLESEMSGMDRVRELLQRTLQIAEGKRARSFEVETLRVWARMEHGWGNAAEASDLLREVVRRTGANEGPFEDERAETCAMLRETIQLMNEPGERPARAAALRDLALLERERSRSAEARAALEESLRLWCEIGDSRARAETLVLLGEVEIGAGLLRQGMAHIREAIAILDLLGPDHLERLDQVQKLARALDSTARGRVVGRIVNRGNSVGVSEEPAGEIAPGRKIILRGPREDGS